MRASVVGWVFVLALSCALMGACGSMTYELQGLSFLALCLLNAVFYVVLAVQNRESFRDELLLLALSSTLLLATFLLSVVLRQSEYARVTDQINRLVLVVAHLSILCRSLSLGPRSVRVAVCLAIAFFGLALFHDSLFSGLYQIGDIRTRFFAVGAVNLVCRVVFVAAFVLMAPLDRRAAIFGGVGNVLFLTLFLFPVDVQHVSGSLMAYVSPSLSLVGSILITLALIRLRKQFPHWGRLAVFLWASFALAHSILSLVSVNCCHLGCMREMTQNLALARSVLLKFSSVGHAALLVAFAGMLYRRSGCGVYEDAETPLAPSPTKLRPDVVFAYGSAVICVLAVLAALWSAVSAMDKDEYSGAIYLSLGLKALKVTVYEALAAIAWCVYVLVQARAWHHLRTQGTHLVGRPSPILSALCPVADGCGILAILGAFMSLPPFVNYFGGAAFGVSGILIFGVLSWTWFGQATHFKTMRDISAWVQGLVDEKGAVCSRSKVCFDQVFAVSLIVGGVVQFAVLMIMDVQFLGIVLGASALIGGPVWGCYILAQVKVLQKLQSLGVESVSRVSSGLFILRTFAAVGCVVCLVCGALVPYEASVMAKASLFAQVMPERVALLSVVFAWSAWLCLGAVRFLKNQERINDIIHSIRCK